MQRALAPFHKRKTEGDGPFYHLEKPEATRNMTGDTLVGVSTMRARGPDLERWPTPAAPDNSTYRGVETDHGNNLTVKTNSLGPRHPRYQVSPVSQASQALISDISPISPSSPSDDSSRELAATTAPTSGPPMSGPPVSGPPAGGGTAMSIAGSEVRVVRIPPRISRTPATGSNPGAWRPDSSRTASSVDLRPPSMSSVGEISIRQASMLSVNNGGYKAYHPSLGMRASHVSVGGDSIASSGVLMPESMSWPMPPSHTGSPDRH